MISNTPKSGINLKIILRREKYNLTLKCCPEKEIFCSFLPRKLVSAQKSKNIYENKKNQINSWFWSVGNLMFCPDFKRFVSNVFHLWEKNSAKCTMCIQKRAENVQKTQNFHILSRISCWNGFCECTGSAGMYVCAHPIRYEPSGQHNCTQLLRKQSENSRNCPENSRNCPENSRK